MDFQSVQRRTGSPSYVLKNRILFRGKYLRSVIIDFELVAYLGDAVHATQDFLNRLLLVVRINFASKRDLSLVAFKEHSTVQDVRVLADGRVDPVQKWSCLHTVCFQLKNSLKWLRLCHEVLPTIRIARHCMRERGRNFSQNAPQVSDFPSSWIMESSPISLSFLIGEFG